MPILDLDYIEARWPILYRTFATLKEGNNTIFLTRNEFAQLQEEEADANEDLWIENLFRRFDFKPPISAPDFGKLTVYIISDEQAEQCIF